jgi:hypothetical protein
MAGDASLWKCCRPDTPLTSLSNVSRTAPLWNDQVSKGIGHGGKKECLYGPNPNAPATGWDLPEAPPEPPARNPPTKPLHDPPGDPT